MLGLWLISSEHAPTEPLLVVYHIDGNITEDNTPEILYNITNSWYTGLRVLREWFPYEQSHLRRMIHRLDDL